MARRKISDKGNSKLATRLARPEPKGIKYGRSYEMHRKPLQLSLYDIVGFLAEDYKEKITLTIGTEEERRLGVTLLSIKRVDFALRELLPKLSKWKHQGVYRISQRRQTHRRNPHPHGTNRGEGVQMRRDKSAIIGDSETSLWQQLLHEQANNRDNPKGYASRPNL